MSELMEPLGLQTHPYNAEDVEMTVGLVHDIFQGQGIQPPEMDDLFGHEEIRAPTSPTPSGPESEGVPSLERERRRALEYEEEEVAPEIAVEVKEAQVKFPNLPVPRSSDGNCWVMRMPNFVNVDTKPFHPETYIGPEQEDEDLQGDNIREKSMTIKLRVENTLRWRWTKDENDQDKRESNARIVRWSDGTLSLRLGKEFFDVTQSIDSSGRMSRSTLGGSQQSQPPQSSQPGVKSEGLTYLVAQHKRSQILQAEALITGYMSLRPAGMQSETHRLLVKAVGQKHNKVARLIIVPEPTVDPEREKLELIKQSAKKSKSRKSAQDEYGYSKKRKRMQRSMDRGDIYTDDEDESGMYAGEDEDEDERGPRSSPRKSKKKVGEGTGEDYQADDFVVPDESDEEDGRRSKKKVKDEGDEDELERMEATIEKQFAAKKAHGSDNRKVMKGDDDEENGEEPEMDVESEEEEFKVRRVASKRAVVEEEDE